MSAGRKPILYCHTWGLWRHAETWAIGQITSDRSGHGEAAMVATWDGVHGLWRDRRTGQQWAPPADSLRFFRVAAAIVATTKPDLSLACSAARHAQVAP